MSAKERLKVRLDFDKRLGNKPPYRPFSAIAVKFKNYITDAEKLLRAELPGELAELHLAAANYAYATGIKSEQIKMFLNDQRPDCTIAQVGHCDLTHEWRSRKDYSPVTDEAILRMFKETGREQGLGDNEGRYNELVLQYWARTGLQQPDGTMQKILGYAVVDYTDLDESRAAGRIFGGTCNSVGLPERALHQLNNGQRWSLQAGPGSLAIGSWGYHAMFGPAWNSYGQLYMTWGDRQQATKAWFKQFTVEQFVVVTEDWLNAEGLTIHGMNLDALLSDLGEVNR